MKSQRNIVALLSILAAVTFGTNQADAVASNNDSLEYGTKPSAQKLLSQGSEKEFARFAEQKSVNLVKYIEYQHVMRVVTLFNADPAQFLKLSPEQQNEFRKNVTGLQIRLGQIRNPEAQTWQHRLSTTVHTMNYLWKSSADEPAVEPLEVQVW